jgi:hypothetical protein
MGEQTSITVIGVGGGKYLERDAMKYRTRLTPYKRQYLSV